RDGGIISGFHAPARLKSTQAVADVLQHSTVLDARAAECLAVACGRLHFLQKRLHRKVAACRLRRGGDTGGRRGQRAHPDKRASCVHIVLPPEGKAASPARLPYPHIGSIKTGARAAFAYSLARSRAARASSRVESSVGIAQL